MDHHTRPTATVRFHDVIRLAAESAGYHGHEPTSPLPNACELAESVMGAERPRVAFRPGCPACLIAYHAWAMTYPDDQPSPAHELAAVRVNRVLREMGNVLPLVPEG